ncbi:hypothetical protein GPX89_29805 [Nocardia sp. ET3-3]|uniref:Uncharacterized protein n=1 Tax=Nocardia terrae TaxID=2675851 RepID=A0A7K1V479_9NOCA|nr:hypothetical protein [Nocardia terrae]MVU81424.1 hypothetical protein [Nocardia terrae]
MGEWLLGIAFGTTATAAASMDPAVRQVTPIGLPGGVAVIPADPQGATAVLRAVLDAALFTRSGPPPAGLAFAYPDQWAPQQVAILTQAAAALGYPANLVRLMPISAAAVHHSAGYPEDNAVSAAARGALLAATGPLAADQAPRQSAPMSGPSPVGPRRSAPRTGLIVAAVAALVVVIGGAATAAIVLASSGGDTTSAAAGTTTNRTTAMHPTVSPTTTPAVTSARPPAAGDSTSPVPPPPPESSTVSPEPPPTTTTRPAPTTDKPTAPEQPAPPAKPTTSEVPPTDIHEAVVRGTCKGFLDEVDTFPGGLAGMRAALQRPFFTSEADWDEAWARAATGSCY